MTHLMTKPLLLLHPISTAVLCPVGLRLRNGPKIRHCHHDNHCHEHGMHGRRTLQTESRNNGPAILPQRYFHRYIHRRMRPQINRITSLLFQTTVERIRFRSSSDVYLRYGEEK